MDRFGALVFIAVGGALGAVGRYLVSGWSYDLLGRNFPYGTLVVNVVGCFLLGLVAHLGQTTELLTERMRMGIAIGFLGGLTTFSTFGYETLVWLEDGERWVALLNIVASVVLGLLAVWAGLALARILWGGA